MADITVRITAEDSVAINARKAKEKLETKLVGKADRSLKCKKDRLAARAERKAGLDAA